MTDAYAEFLATKMLRAAPVGFEPDTERFPVAMKSFQGAITGWSCRRCLQLWSNPGDIVFSPFAGIGSELYCAVEMGRKALGAELKESYFIQAIANMRESERTAAEPSVFGGAI